MFVGKDVAVALGYAEPRSAVSKKVDEEDRGVAEMETASGKQNMSIINESGLYSLIFGSKLGSAKRFKHWVTHEVLPAIRKTGAYMVKTPQRCLTTDDYINAARIVAGCRNERMPYVLSFLEQGGFSIPKVEQTAKEEIQDTELIDLLNGFSLSELVEKLNICKSSLHYYRTGQHHPSEERRAYIFAALV